MDQNDFVQDAQRISKSAAYEGETADTIYASEFLNPPQLAFEADKPKKEDQNTEKQEATEVDVNAELNENSIQNTVEKGDEEKEEQEEKTSLELTFAEAPPEVPEAPEENKPSGDGGSNDPPPQGGIDDEDESPLQKKEGENTELEGSTNETDIPTEVLTKMEGAFNTDFSDVEINTNSAEAESVNALAFAKGNRIDFAPGQYNPNSHDGQELLGHELAHIVQQREGKVKPTTEVNGMAVNDDSALEKEADQLGAKAASTPVTEPFQLKSETSPSAPPPIVQKSAPTVSTGRTTIVQTSSTYDVSGTYREVKAELLLPGEDGSITTNFSDVHYALINRDRNLRAELEVTIAKSMPNWVEFPRVQELANDENERHREYYQRIVSVWTRYIASLDAHEEAHRAIDLRTFRNAHRRLRGKTEEQAETELTTIETEAHNLHEAFHDSDESTIMRLPYIQKPAERKRPSERTPEDEVQYKEAKTSQLKKPKAKAGGSIKASEDGIEVALTFTPPAKEIQLRYAELKISSPFTAKGEFKLKGKPAKKGGSYEQGSDNSHTAKARFEIYKERIKKEGSKKISDMAYAKLKKDGGFDIVSADLVAGASYTEEDGESGLSPSVGVVLKLRNGDKVTTSLNLFKFASDENSGPKLNLEYEYALPSVKLWSNKIAEFNVSGDIKLLLELMPNYSKICFHLLKSQGRKVILARMLPMVSLPALLGVGAAITLFSYYKMIETIQGIKTAASDARKAKASYVSGFLEDIGVKKYKTYKKNYDFYLSGGLDGNKALFDQVRKIQSHHYFKQYKFTSAELVPEIKAACNKNASKLNQSIAPMAAGRIYPTFVNQYYRKREAEWMTGEYRAFLDAKYVAYRLGLDETVIKRVDGADVAAQGKFTHQSPVVQKNDRTAWFKDELKKTLNFENTDAPLFSFIDTYNIDYEEVNKAAKNAATTSDSSDLRRAAEVYAIAKQAEHSTVSDVLSGAISVESLNSDEIKEIAHEESDGFYSTMDVSDTRQKADTLYLKSGPSVSDLDFRALIIHELEHALDDKNASEPSTLPALEFEINGYWAQAAYLMDQFTGTEDSAKEEVRAQIAKVLKSNLGLVMGLCMILKANEEGAYKTTAVDLLSTAPMTENTPAEIESLIAMSFSEIMTLVEEKLSNLDMYKGMPELINVDGLAPIQRRENDTTEVKEEPVQPSDMPAGVNIHENSAKASEMGALAYAQGNEIHFAPGQYNPSTKAGKSLIGHELAHIKQQREGRVKKTTAHNGMPVNDDPQLEQEADKMGEQYAGGKGIPLPSTQQSNGIPQFKTEAWKKVYSVPFKYKMTASLHLGLVFTPVDKTGEFIQDVDKLEQQTIYAFKVFSSKYSEPLAEAFLKRMMTAPLSKEGKGMPSEGEKLTGIAFNIPSIYHVMDFFKENNLIPNISDAQVLILSTAENLDRMWPNVEEYLMTYKWFSLSLFKILVANKKSLLHKYFVLNNKVKKGDPSDTEIDQHTDLENEIADPILEKEATIDVIRRDEKLISMWEYKLLWEQELKKEDGTETENKVAAEDKINFRCAVEVFKILDLHKEKAALAAKSSKEGTEARKEILKYMVFVLGKAGPNEYADSVLTDKTKQANLPAFPSSLNAVPPLKNYRTGSGSERDFRMSVRFDDIYDALGATFNPNFTYTFDLIKISDEKVREYMQVDKKKKVSELDKALAAGKVAGNEKEKSESIGGWAEMTNKWGRRNKHLKEDLETAVDYMEESVFHSVAGAGLVDAALIGHGLGYVGDVVATFVKTLMQPSYEESIPFTEPGFYIVRAYAGLADISDDMLGLRPPSFAWMPVYVESARKMAHSEKDNLETNENVLKKELAKVTKELEKKDLKAAKRKKLEIRKAELEILVNGSAGSIHSMRLKNLEKEKEKQKNLKIQIAAKEGELKALRKELTSLKQKDKKEALQKKIDQKHADLQVLKKSSKSAVDLKKTDASIKDMKAIEETAKSRQKEFQLVETGLEGAIRIPATFTQEDGNQFQLMLDVYPTKKKGKKLTYYASDLTHKKGQGEKGEPKTTRNDAIKSAISSLLRSPYNYGRGYVSILIPAPTINPANIATEKAMLKIKPDETGILLTGIESLVTIAEIAAVAAAPFTGGTSLSLLVPLGIVGSIPAAYRLYNAADDNIFDWSDPATILDIIDVVGSLAGIGSKVSKGFKMIPLSQGFAIVDIASGKFGMLVGGVNFLAELHKISSDKTLSDGEKKARIAMLIGNQMKTYGIMGIQKHYENAEKATDTADIDPKKLPGPDTDPKLLTDGKKPKQDGDVDPKKKDDDPETPKPKPEEDPDLKTIPDSDADADSGKKKQDDPLVHGYRKSKIEAQDPGTILKMLKKAGSWKKLIQELEAAGHEKLATSIAAYREIIVRDLVEKAGGLAKELDDASKENISDIDLNFTGPDAGSNLLKAESYMEKSYGTKWSKLFRLNFYTDASRLKKVLDTSGKDGGKIERKISIKSAELNFAKMLILAKGKEAKKRIIRLMEKAGVDYAAVKPFLAETPANREKKRKSLQLEMDTLVKKHEDASAEEKATLALEITEKQMLLNFYSDEAYISPGSMIKGKKSDDLAFSDMTSQLQMVEETIAKAGGDPVRALREYEMYKYMFRFAEAVHDKQLDLFMNYLNQKFYKSDRSGPGKMTDAELIQVWNRFRKYANQHLADKSPLKKAPVQKPKQVVDTGDDPPPPSKQLPLFPAKKKEEVRKMTGKPKDQPSSHPEPTTTSGKKSEGEQNPLLEKLSKGDPDAPEPKTYKSNKGLPEDHSTLASGIKDYELAHMMYEDALTVSNGREVAIFLHETSGEYIVRMGDHNSVSSGEGGYKAIVHFHPQVENAPRFALPSEMDFLSVAVTFLNSSDTKVREVVESHIPGKGRTRVEYGLERTAKGNLLFVNIHNPDGTVTKKKFNTDEEYQAFYKEHEAYVEPGSQLHKTLIEDLDQFYSKLGLGGAGSGNRKMAGGEPGRDDKYKNRHITETEYLRDDTSVAEGSRANPIKLEGALSRADQLASAGDAGSIASPMGTAADGGPIKGCGVFRQYILFRGEIVEAAIKVYPTHAHYPKKLKEDVVGGSAAEATGIGPKIFGYVDIGEPDKIAFAMQVVKGDFIGDSSQEYLSAKEKAANKASADAATRNIGDNTFAYLETYRDRLIENGYYYSGEVQGLVDSQGRYNPIDFTGISKLPPESEPVARAEAIETHKKNFAEEISSHRKASESLHKKEGFRLKPDSDEEPDLDETQELEPFKP